MEFQEICGKRPVTETEAVRARDNLTLELPGAWETKTKVARRILDVYNLGLAEHYYQNLSSRLQALTHSDVAAVAGKPLRPGQLVWVVIGDRAKIEAGLKELGLGEIQLLDADGNSLPQ